VTDFADIRKRATLPTRTVSLCLAGELAEELVGLEQQFLQLGPAENLADSRKRELADEITAKREEMRDASVDFRLRALPAREWSKLWAHYPVKEEKEDGDAFEERAWPFYAEVVSRVCVDPQMSVEQVGELCDLIHSKAYNDLANACLALNSREIDIPNSVAASELTPTSEQT
jgi:hypothetical protein